MIEWNTNPDGGYDSTSWKARLQKQYSAKGKALTRALRAAGYDGIITVRKFRGEWETSECVDLTAVKV